MKTSPCSAPRMVARAWGLQPVGLPTEERVQCCLTGEWMEPGEIVHPFDYGCLFTDWRAVIGKSRMISGWVKAVSSAAVLNKLKRAVITDGEVLSIFSNEEVTSFLMDPPPPPFFVVQVETKRAHVVWRVPMTRDVDYILIRRGAKIYGLRRRVVLSLVSPAKQVCALAEAKEPTTPFISANFEEEHGRIRPDLVDAARKQGLSDVIQQLQLLNPIESWALSVLLWGKGQTSKPRKIVI